MAKVGRFIEDRGARKAKTFTQKVMGACQGTIVGINFYLKGHGGTYKYIQSNFSCLELLPVDKRIF